MVNFCKGLTLKTTILHLHVFPEVISFMFCVFEKQTVFVNKDSDTDLFAIAFIWTKERCVCRSVGWSHTHTHTHHCWPFISYRSNTELLVGDIIAYFILCAWITLSFDFTKTLFCDIKINSNSFEQENGAVLKYVSTETCITERDVQKHKNRVLTYIQHRTITKDLQLMLHPQIRRKPEMIFTIKYMKHQYFI